MGSCPWHLPQGLCFHSGTLFPLRGGGEMQHVFQAPRGTAGPQSPPPVSTFSLSPVRPWFLLLKCPPAALLGLQKEMVMAGRRERVRAQGPRQEDVHAGLCFPIPRPGWQQEGPTSAGKSLLGFEGKPGCL